MVNSHNLDCMYKNNDIFLILDLNGYNFFFHN